MDEQKRAGFSDAENELNKKQVFADLNTKHTQRPVLIESYNDLPEPAFNKKAVLDEAYAEQKTKREKNTAARPPQDSARRELNTALPKLPKRPSGKMRRVKPVRFRDVYLCSGELSSDALLRIAREFGALLLFCAIVGVVFWLRGFIIDQMTDVDYSALARSTSYSDPVTVGGINWTDTELQDGFAAAQAVCAKLDAPITDRIVFEKHPEALLYPKVVSACMETAFDEDRVQLKTNMSNLDLLLQIYMSLDSGKPVIVLLSEKDSDFLHYAVVTYMDAENDCITVQLSDGETQTLTFEQFIAASRFKNTEELPFKVRTGLAFGSWARNTAIFIE